MLTGEILKIMNKSLVDMLGDNLVGIYIHGSYAMSGFNPEMSDIDVLVVVKENLEPKVKRSIISLLIELSQKGPEKGIELSILLEEDARRAEHPMYFILHFSNDHISRYLEDENYMCENMHDYDLAAHIKMLLERGYTLSGQGAESVFGSISNEHFIDSLIRDSYNAKPSSESESIYCILNLIRFRYYLKEGEVYSKVEGALKALEEFDPVFTKTIESCLSRYIPDKYAYFSLDSMIVSKMIGYLNDEIERLYNDKIRI